MLDENLIPTLEQSLVQTRNVQNRLMARLREAESDVELLRLEINALENSAAQTAKALESLRGNRTMSLGKSLTITDDIESSLSQRRRDQSSQNDASSRNFRSDNSSVTYLYPNRNISTVNNSFEPLNTRFSDRTITQACTLLLSEAGGPLHVNDLYHLLVAGGMKFKGNNPTISVAVSLSRNRRFRKVDPGTFDLGIREARQAAS